MFEFFEGQIVQTTPSYIVLLVNGIGYLIYTADPFKYEPDETKTIRIYVHQTISESAQYLYGFYEFEDKQMFEKLLSVSGIGAKSALAILAGNDRSGLINAINSDDIKFLTKFPGVGKKTAQQIILDLKGKLEEFSQDLFTPEQSISHTELSNEFMEAKAALIALGYSEKQLDKISDQLLSSGATSTNEFLSTGLSLLTK